MERHEDVLKGATLGTAWRAHTALDQAVRPWLQSNQDHVTGLVNQYGPERGTQLAAQSFLQDLRSTPDGAALLGGNPAAAQAGATPPSASTTAPQQPRFSYVQLSPWQKFDPTGIWSSIGTNGYWHGVGDVLWGYYDVSVGAMVSAGEAMLEAPKNAADLFSAVSDQSQLGADTILPTLGGAATETGKAVVTNFKDFGEKLYEGDNRAGGQLVGSILFSAAAEANAIRLVKLLKTSEAIAPKATLVAKGLGESKVPVSLSKKIAEKVSPKLAEDASKVAAPKAKIPKIGGRRPVNSKYAGKTHPSGVKFTEKGFPDFSPYSKAQVILDALTGDSRFDSRLANEAMGYPKTPMGFTWHHVEDGKTLHLVPTNLHDVVKHTGGSAVIRNGGLFDL